jgi:HAD superfamily hydrolase (TIGR01484 family)
MPERADLTRFWLMPTTGTKLYVFRKGAWVTAYAELLDQAERASIIEAFEVSLQATGLTPDKSWGERIEDRGSQITFSALGQQAPLEEKQAWDPDFAKRKRLQADLQPRLPAFSIKLGGTTSIDVTRSGVDKAYGLKRLSQESGIPLSAMLFVGDAIFPGGNDYPARELGLDTVAVRNPDETITVIATAIACLR